MSRRKVRLFFAVLLLAVLTLNGFDRRPLLVAAATMTVIQPAPPLSRSYRVAAAPPIAGWPTAANLFYRAGAAYPVDLPDPYVDPAFELTMLRLRPAIVASAARHNRRAVTGISDDQFAVVLAAQLYFEYNSTLATRNGLGRAITPIYQEAQEVANVVGMGNFSVWPANLRPSVAASLLRGEMPYITASNVHTARLIPLTIHGSRLQALMRQRHPGEWEPSESVITEEIARPELAVEYLAANFEVASYRAQFDWAPVSWMTFAAWHNQGVVSPASIAANGQLAQVLPTIETYLPAAMRLVYVPPLPQPAFVRTPLAR
jgi:hypothetical protein